MTWVSVLLAAAAVALALPGRGRAGRVPVSGPMPGGVNPVCGVNSVLGVGWWRSRRRAAADGVAVLEVSDALAVELVAGRTPGEALATAAELWPPMGQVVEAFHLGGDVAAELRTLARTRPGASDLRLVAGAWQVSHRSGHGLARALERTSRGIRARQRTRRLVESELASSRATARLVACLPLLVLLAGSGSGGDPWQFLLATPVGWACLVAGLGLIAAGLWAIERIADGAAPP